MVFPKRAICLEIRAYPLARAPEPLLLRLHGPKLLSNQCMNIYIYIRSKYTYTRNIYIYTSSFFKHVTKYVHQIASSIASMAFSRTKEVVLDSFPLQKRCHLWNVLHCFLSKLIWVKLSNVDFPIVLSHDCLENRFTQSKVVWSLELWKMIIMGI